MGLGVEGEDDVDDTCKGIFIGGIGVLFLNVGLMGSIGSDKVVVDGITIHVETELTATDVDEHVDIVAGGVAFEGFEALGHGDGHLHRSFIVSTRHEHVGKTAG